MVGLGGVVVAVVLSGCAASPSVSAPSGPTVTVTGPPVTGTVGPSAAPGAVTAPPVTVTVPRPPGSRGAVSALAALAVKGRAPKTGYDRAMFGQAWSDDVSVEGGHNGGDTRNDVLRRDLRSVGLKLGSSGCTVLTGALQDPYTG